MIHYGWAIVAALAGFILGALLMSLISVASYADRVEELGVDVTNPPSRYTAVTKE